MKTKQNKLITITTILCLLPLILSFYYYDKLPDQIAIHFDAHGNPNNYASKAIAAYGIPIFMAAINLFSHFVLEHDPKKKNASVALQLIGKWTIPVMTIILVPATLYYAMGYDIPFHLIVPALVGAIFTACGNYMPKCKQNYTVGIKVPWTLNNEENWNKTHHLAGYLWTVGGIVIVISSFIQNFFILIFFFIFAVMLLVPIGYSFWLHKQGL